MATGITLNKWDGEVEIIPNERFPASAGYELFYEGKMPIEELLNYKPAQSYDKLISGNQDNLLFYGDNLDVMSYLLQDFNLKGKVKLVYIDPPYATNSLFINKHQKDSYRDDLIGSHYIEFLRKRLVLLRELLSEDGSLYLHLDSNMVFEAKIILDEVFGNSNYRGLITRKKCSNKNYTVKTYGNISDFILFYSKTNNFTWHRPTVAWTDEKIIKEYPSIDEATGRRYKKVPIHAPGVRNGATGKEWRGMLPPLGKHWQFTPDKLDELDKNGDIYWSANGNPRRKVYLDEDKGVPVQDIWLDVQDSLNQNIKTTGYPTEKNPALLDRIIRSCTNKGDLVLDCFAGSGTTCGTAQHIGRRWIGIDSSSEAIASIFKRLTNDLEDFGDYVTSLKQNGNLDNAQQVLFEPVSDYESDAKFSFSFYSDRRFCKSISERLGDYLNTPIDCAQHGFGASGADE